MSFNNFLLLPPPSELRGPLAVKYGKFSNEFFETVDLMKNKLTWSLS